MEREIAVSAGGEWEGGSSNGRQVSGGGVDGIAVGVGGLPNRSGFGGHEEKLAKGVDGQAIGGAGKSNGPHRRGSSVGVEGKGRQVIAGVIDCCRGISKVSPWLELHAADRYWKCKGAKGIEGQLPAGGVDVVDVDKSLVARASRVHYLTGEIRVLSRGINGETFTADIVVVAGSLVSEEPGLSSIRIERHSSEVPAHTAGYVEIPWHGEDSEVRGSGEGSAHRADRGVATATHGGSPRGVDAGNPGV